MMTSRSGVSPGPLLDARRRAPARYVGSSGGGDDLRQINHAGRAAPSWTAPPASPREEEAMSIVTGTSFGWTPSQSDGRYSPRGRAKSPPKPTSPRMRMNDLLFGPHSPTRVPSTSPPRTYPSSCYRAPVRTGSPRASRMNSPCRSPRGRDGRDGLGASNECLLWLKRCQSDAHVEDTVEQKMIDEADSPSKHMQYRMYTKDQLRNPTYRNATKSATSLAARAKPPQWH